MKTVLVLSIICFGFFATDAAAQGEKTQIRGTVVGYDVLIEQEQTTYAPLEARVVIFKLDGPTSSDNIKYVKLLYNYLDDHLPKRAGASKYFLSDKQHHLILEVSRDKDCDSDLAAVKYSKVTSIETGQELEPLLRLKDLGGLDAISDDTVLPCYKLDNDGILVPETSHCPPIDYESIGLIENVCLGHIVAGLDQKEWWFNVPGAPLKMELSPKKDFLLLTNYSQKYVSEYQLGCVCVKEGQSPKIYRRWGYQKALRLNPSTEDNLFVESVDDKFNNEKICANGKLAVIAVSFKDGSKYSIKGESSKRAEKP